MKFTIERLALIRLLEVVGKKMPTQKRAGRVLRLTACSARVFAEANSTTAGMEALVLQDGTCSLDLKSFLSVLRTYEGKENLIFEAGPNWIKFGTTIMNTTAYSPKAVAPGKFQVFPVTDTWLARISSPAS